MPAHALLQVVALGAVHVWVHLAHARVFKPYEGAEAPEPRHQVPHHLYYGTPALREPGRTSLSVSAAPYCVYRSSNRRTDSPPSSCGVASTSIAPKAATPSCRSLGFPLTLLGLTFFTASFARAQAHFLVRKCRFIMCRQTTEPQNGQAAFFLRCCFNHAFLSNFRCNLLNASISASFTIFRLGVTFLGYTSTFALSAVLNLAQPAASPE